MRAQVILHSCEDHTCPPCRRTRRRARERDEWSQLIRRRLARRKNPTFPCNQDRLQRQSVLRVQVFAVSYLLGFGCQLHRGREIVRQWRFKIFPFMAARMSKPNFPGVQHLSRKIFCRTRRIDFVAEHWMTEMMKVHADLVGASAMQTAFDKACFSSRSNNAIFGLGRAPTR